MSLIITTSLESPLTITCSLMSQFFFVRQSRLTRYDLTFPLAFSGLFHLMISLIIPWPSGSEKTLSCLGAVGLASGVCKLLVTMDALAQAVSALMDTVTFV